MLGIQPTLIALHILNIGDQNNCTRVQKHYRSFRRQSSGQSLALVRQTTQINSKINQTNTKSPEYNNILPTYTCTQT